MTALQKESQGFSTGAFSVLPAWDGGVSWTSEDFIEAHNLIKSSGKFNFEGCKIPIPTAIRYDRIGAALGGEASPRELRVLSLLRFGIPINCKPDFGVRRQQKNHFLAVAHKQAIQAYLAKNVQAQALIGPFAAPPSQGYSLVL